MDPHPSSTGGQPGATNRLIDATSPYLLQHAHNPVDWYQWGTEALDRARREDRPILLSIGYAACHWCHVMAHESFEDRETAGFMNEYFVCIKVDREERPDLDAIYMDAVQHLTGHGGWPMTVFLTPDGVPFYGGTYFPPEDRHGLPGFPRLLRSVAEAWREQRDQLVGQGRQVAARISAGAALNASSDPLTDAVLLEAHAGMSRMFDTEWGGFGSAPKFPQPMTLEFLLRMHHRGQPDSLEMMVKTLDHMANGGMYDQIAGGFHRYSTDRRWLVPHFEKMLYDNAQLARLYVHAWQVTRSDRYKQVATETLDYLLRELRHPDGGLFSSQDADSEGVEGKFYVWPYGELTGIAGEAVARFFGAASGGNWEGANILWRPRPLGGVAEEFGMSPDELKEAVEEAKPRLLEARSKRVPPGTDDKVLAAWNGLAIVALAEAGRTFSEARFVEGAVAAGNFVLTRLLDGTGRLRRSWRDGRTSGPGYADDHAAMGLACLELYQTTFDVRWFEEAKGLAGDLVRLFHDPDRGGFFQTGSDAEALVYRPKELFDNAVPSGNSLAAELLQRLAHLTGDPDQERVGVSALRLARDLMVRAPTMLGHALGAVDLYLSTAKEIAIVGDPAGPDTHALVGAVWRRYLPNAVLAVGQPADGAVVPLLADRTTVDGKATAYVCERFVCRRPVTEPAELAVLLED